MVFSTSAALLEGVVLAVIERDAQGAYGYCITRTVTAALGVSDSTLYPVLRRLQKEECLRIDDSECNGRLRRYYRLTKQGIERLAQCRAEWRQYSQIMNGLFEERSDKT